MAPKKENFSLLSLAPSWLFVPPSTTLITFLGGDSSCSREHLFFGDSLRRDVLRGESLFQFFFFLIGVLGEMVQLSQLDQLLDSIPELVENISVVTVSTVEATVFRLIRLCGFFHRLGLLDTDDKSSYIILSMFFSLF